ncbi:MAG: hypothetical protein V2I43_13950 [Parvularcula sp.]|nr:hypothetical protein [Parvularcula sp.]
MTNMTAGGSKSDAPDKQELKEDAVALKESAKKQAEAQAERGRDQAVGMAKSASSAIDKAAEELRNNNDAPDWMAGILSSAAQKIGQVASELDGKSSQQMLNSAQQFGRQQPAMFLAASAAAGFAAGRFLRAGAEQHDDVDLVEPNSNSDADEQPAVATAPIGSSNYLTTGGQTQ